MEFNSLAWKLLSSTMFLELLIYSHTLQDFSEHATQYFNPFQFKGFDLESSVSSQLG